MADTNAVQSDESLMVVFLMSFYEVRDSVALSMLDTELLQSF